MSSTTRKQSGPRSTDDDTNNDLKDTSKLGFNYSITLHDEGKEVRKLEIRLDHVLWMETRLKSLKTELESSLKNDPRAKDVPCSSKRKSPAFKVVFGCSLVLAVVAVPLGVVRLDTTGLSSVATTKPSCETTNDGKRAADHGRFRKVGCISA
jgi:hypothetical protein